MSWSKYYGAISRDSSGCALLNVACESKGAVNIKVVATGVASMDFAILIEKFFLGFWAQSED